MRQKNKRAPEGAHAYSISIRTRYRMPSTTLVLTGTQCRLQALLITLLATVTLLYSCLSRSTFATLTFIRTNSFSSRLSLWFSRLGNPFTISINFIVITSNVFLVCPLKALKNMRLLSRSMKQPEELAIQFVICIFTARDSFSHSHHVIG